MFGRATVTLGIGPHSSCTIILVTSARIVAKLHAIIACVTTALRINHGFTSMTNLTQKTTKDGRKTAKHRYWFYCLALEKVVALKRTGFDRIGCYYFLAHSVHGHLPCFMVMFGLAGALSTLLVDITVIAQFVLTV